MPKFVRSMKAETRKVTSTLTRDDVRQAIMSLRRDRREIQLAVQTSDAMSERAGKPQTTFARMATMELAAIDIVLAKLEVLY